MKLEDLINAIDVLTKIVQPKNNNNVTFSTQNKAQSLLADLLLELESRNKIQK